jgi:hypothetical protein
MKKHSSVLQSMKPKPTSTRYGMSWNETAKINEKARKRKAEMSFIGRQSFERKA